MSYDALLPFPTYDFAQSALLEIPPTVSESIWASLSNNESMLFQYAYSGDYASQHWINSVLFRRVSSVFDFAIEPLVLRYSILAYLAHHAPNRDRLAWNEEKYRTIALRMLSNNLRNRKVEEADLFAAYFLALRTPWHSLKSIQHYQGCIAIYRFLARNPTNRTSLFTVYGPFILDEFTTWLNTERALRSDVNTSASQRIHIEWPSFPLFLQHITPFSSPRWPSPHLASVLLLWYYLRLLASSIVRVVDGQCRGEYDKDHIVEALVEAVKSRFYAAELQDFLIGAEARLDDAIRRYTVKEAAPLLLITSWCVCIRIAIRIVEDRDALSALQGDDVQLYAVRLASYLRTYPNEHATTISVVLAGLGLPRGKLGTERKSNSGQWFADN